MKTTMLALLLMAATATQSVGQGGTIIGGVEWADANVSTPDTFAAQPNARTQYYWWNRDKAWATYGANEYEWHAEGEPNWTANICPDGWRLPTQVEFESLINSGRTWADANTKGNAVDGMFFGANHATATIGNMQGCIFLSASGSRRNLDGSVNYSAVSYGSRGGYWSITSNGAGHTTILTISPTYVNVVGLDKKSTARTARCVQAPTESGEGTIISGVKWANTNVAQPGYFADSADKHTEFYQWNSNKPWAATGLVDLDEWKEATEQEWTVNVCPEGWRVPTKDEFQALINSGYTPTLANSPYGYSYATGMFFGANHATATLDDMQGCIYLPIQSYLDGDDGRFFSPGSGGYWSSTQSNILEEGYNLFMTDAANVLISTGAKTTGLNIRCVRSVDLPNVNGILWAETNLTADGTFASRPDMFTNFFQWSRNTDWNTTTGGSSMPGWHTTPITATEWADDPCPDSWRLPTQHELQELAESSSTFAWEYEDRGNEVSGRFFGPRHAVCSLPDDIQGCIFLPASGYRNPSRGRLLSDWEFGYYWSHEQANLDEGYSLYFGEQITPAVDGANKLSGYNIRCVYDPKAISNSTTQSMSTFSLARANSNGAIPKLFSITDTVNTMSGAAISSTAQEKLSQSVLTTPATTATQNLERTAELAAATLYPNPVVNGQLTIDNGELAIGKVEVLNHSGAVVRTQDFGSQTTGTLQLQGLQGSYFIRIGKSTQSIVVAK